MSDFKRYVYCQICGQQSATLPPKVLSQFFNRGKAGGWMLGWVASTEFVGTHILCPTHAPLLKHLDKAQARYNEEYAKIEEMAKELEEDE